jgi:hypothetical protein
MAASEVEKDPLLASVSEHDLFLGELVDLASDWVGVGYGVCFGLDSQHPGMD